MCPISPQCWPTLKNGGSRTPDSHEAKGEFDRALAEFEWRSTSIPHQQDAKEGLARVARGGTAPSAAPSAVPALAAAAAPTQAASSVRQLFEKHRLPGIWAPDCSTPVSAQNMCLVVRLLDEHHAQFDRMESATTRNSAYAAQAASEPQPSEIAVQVRGPRPSRADASDGGRPAARLRKVGTGSAARA
jgi:hypothetical protein